MAGRGTAFKFLANTVRSLSVNFEEEDSDVDFEASRRSTRVQSKTTIRSALFLAKH